MRVFTKLHLLVLYTALRQRNEGEVIGCIYICSVIISDCNGEICKKKLVNRNQICKNKSGSDSWQLVCMPSEGQTPIILYYDGNTICYGTGKTNSAQNLTVR